jgi:general nucleoside transport system permease protein
MALARTPTPPEPPSVEQSRGLATLWLVRVVSSRRTVGAWLLGLGGALSVFAGFVVVLGRNPPDVLGAVVIGAVGTPVGLNRTIARAIPLLLLSAGLLVAFRAKFWNIGLNGGMYMGAIAASGIALYNPSAPGWLILPLMLLAAVATGVAWSLIPGLLRIAFSAPEIIVSLLLNYVAARIADFLVFSYWKDPHGRGFPGTAVISQAFWFPRLPNTNVHLGALFALLAVVSVGVLMNRTVWGLEIDFVGQGRRAAAYLGLNTTRVVLLVSAVSGGLAGLAGAGEVAGLNHRLEAGITQDLGYTAILAVSLGMLRPWLTAAAAVLVAALLVGATQLQVQFGLPSAMAGVLLWALLYGVINAQNLAERAGRH